MLQRQVLVWFGFEYIKYGKTYRRAHTLYAMLSPPLSPFLFLFRISSPRCYGNVRYIRTYALQLQCFIARFSPNAGYIARMIPDKSESKKTKRTFERISVCDAATVREMYDRKMQNHRFSRTFQMKYKSTRRKTNISLRSYFDISARKNNSRIRLNLRERRS